MHGIYYGMFEKSVKPQIETGSIVAFLKDLFDTNEISNNITMC